MNHGNDSANVTATRGEPAHRVTRNHALFGLMLVGLLAALVAAVSW